MVKKRLSFIFLSTSLLWSNSNTLQKNTSAELIQAIERNDVKKVQKLLMTPTSIPQEDRSDILETAYKKQEYNKSRVSLISSTKDLVYLLTGITLIGGGLTAAAVGQIQLLNKSFQNKALGPLRRQNDCEGELIMVNAGIASALFGL